MSEEDPEKAEAEEASETEETQEPDSNNNSKSGTVNLSVNTVIIGAFVLGLTVGFSGGVLTKGNALAGLVGTQEAPAPSQPSDQQGQQGNTDIVDLSQINMSGEPVLGESDAPVTMVIYEDFECPFCKRFEDNAFQNIKSNYVDTGQVKVIWKDRPLTQLHPWAEPAAAAMECVYRESGDDAFWTVKSKIFANQNSISTSNVESQIKTWAAEEGVSESAVQSCIDNDNPLEEVRRDSENGKNLGASGTPTAFVNGRKLVGAQPYSNFKSAIEDALSQ